MKMLVSSASQVTTTFILHSMCSHSIVLIEPRCSNFDLRLVESSTSSMGIVQVCESQDWHTICAEHWDTKDASVVCRQLGFASKGLPHERTLLWFFGFSISGPLLYIQ